MSLYLIAKASLHLHRETWYTVILIVSYFFFFYQLALFQVTVWFLLLLASYLYFADFKSCKANKVRSTH